MPEPATLDLIVIVTYLLLMVGVGVAFSRFNSDTSDYFRAGCRGTWWLVGASSFMLAFSAWTFTGAAGAAYEAGWSVLTLYLANAAGYLINFLFTAAWFRQLRAVTVPEVIRDRFDGFTQQVYAWTSVPANFFYAGLWLYGLAIFSSSIFGFDLQGTIVVLGLVVLLYSVTGGSWAVAGTDFLQGLILVPMTVILAVLCLIELGGVGEMFSQIEAQGLSQDYAVINTPGTFAGEGGTIYTWPWAVAMFLQGIFQTNAVNAAPKYFLVKDGAGARKAALLGCFLFLGGMLVWFIPPITARLLYADQVAATDLNKPAESAFAVASLNVLPPGLVGLVVVCVFTATMSSLDSGLNKNAAVTVRDIIPALWRRFTSRELPSEARLVGWSRVITLVYGLMVIGFALYFSLVEGRGIFSLMLDVMALIGLPLSIPLIFALFIKRVPVWACLFSAGVTFIPSTMAFFAGKPYTDGLPLLGDAWPIHVKVFTNFIVGILSFLATVPFWGTASEAYRKKVDAFFTRMHTPVDFEKEVGDANDNGQLKILGTFASIIGGFILLLCLVPGSLRDRLVILALAACVGGCGAFMLLVVKLRERRDVRS